MKILTGFHPIEEKLRVFQKKDNSGIENVKIFYANPGPRVKKILALAKTLNIKTEEVSSVFLSKKVENLPAEYRDHRGLIMEYQETQEIPEVSLDTFLSSSGKKSKVLLLDGITDPHNIGAIIRSSDQFGIDLIVYPNHGSGQNSQIISKTSAGSSNWVPYAVVSNLKTAVEKLKANGFWIYGADAEGDSIQKTVFPDKTAIIMGSEGKGLSRIVREACDNIISIPTCGKIDSLNVSVAAGIILYSVFISEKQNPKTE